MNTEITTITEIVELEDFDNEYVYDIGINSTHPYFFANDILVHNSCYFSAYTYMKDREDYAAMDWTNVDNIIGLYDAIADEVNGTFSEFLRVGFNVPPEQSVIKAGREVVASTGLFNTKKRYAVMIVDMEGKRKDVGNKPGEIKAMGLEIKRSDTPIPIQTFLEEILEMTLTKSSAQDVMARIKEFRMEFRSWEPWKKGSPKKVNALSDYQGRIEDSHDMKQVNSLRNQIRDCTDPARIIDLEKRLKSITKIPTPGHVTASLNWNKLRDINGDRHSMPIQDGQKIIVCKLRQNPTGMTSIAFPIDESRLPDWFKELPFDEDEMEFILIDKKVKNLIIAMIETAGWNLSDAQHKSMFDSVFKF